MIINFIAENYLSFKKRIELSMTASSSKKLQDNVYIRKKYSLLKSCAIYGANASGKSNLLKAISFMRKMILLYPHPENEIDVESFKLNLKTDNSPSVFEMTFLVKDFKIKNNTSDVVFRYGFELDKNKVHNEWLFARFTVQESKLFVRKGNSIIIGEKFKEGRSVYKTLGKINEKQLFLPLIYSLKGENAPISETIVKYFLNIKDITRIRDLKLYHLTLSLLENNYLNKDTLIEALKLADLGISGFSVEKNEMESSSVINGGTILISHKNKPVNIKLKTLHKKYDDMGNFMGNIKFDYENSESEGTQKFFTVIGPVIDALRNGLILIYDEIDSKLHPSLVKSLVDLFNSDANRDGAQLIFSTHNTDLMDGMRKEQVYFTNKNHYGESELYSLKDIKIRNDMVFSKNYIMGKYGAIPALGNFKNLIKKRK